MYCSFRMKWPVLCMDGFFSNPEAVIKWSSSLKYEKTEGEYPGERTDFLHKIDETFFLNTTKKIMALLYPNDLENIRWIAQQHFQKINTEQHKYPGFIHQDVFAEFTAIVYLTNEEKAGTSIYKRIKEPNPDYDSIKKESYTTLKFKKKFTEVLKKNRENHQKVLQFSALKNRLVLFDSAQHHGVDHFGSKEKERLTLITFFTKIWKEGGDLKSHIRECQKF